MIIRILIAIIVMYGAVQAQEKPQAEKLTWQKLQSSGIFGYAERSSSTFSAFTSPSLGFTQSTEIWMVIKNDEMTIDGLGTECTVFNLQRAVKLTAITVSYHSFQTPEARWVRDVLKACESK